eukprot:c20585_g5_i2.p1 GENE.c20585_g5_i2~~c20585_g5_i2.p1  ORF type:complete len:375 (+),score=5.80 c20585_g5_i2:243-1367(+)
MTDSERRVMPRYDHGVRAFMVAYIAEHWQRGVECDRDLAALVSARGPPRTDKAMQMHRLAWMERLQTFTGPPPALPKATPSRAAPAPPPAPPAAVAPTRAAPASLEGIVLKPCQSSVSNVAEAPQLSLAQPRGSASSDFAQAADFAEQFFKTLFAGQSSAARKKPPLTKPTDAGVQLVARAANHQSDHRVDSPFQFLHVLTREEIINDLANGAWVSTSVLMAYLELAAAADDARASLLLAIDWSLELRPPRPWSATAPVAADFDQVLLPINADTIHWSLAHADLASGTLNLYDSMGSRSHRETFHSRVLPFVRASWLACPRLGAMRSAEQRWPLAENCESQGRVSSPNSREKVMVDKVLPVVCAAVEPREAATR